MNVKILRASVIAPIDRPPIENGAIAFTNQIIEVGDARDVRRNYPSAELIDAGMAIVLPGLVNAHCHLELTDVTRPPAMPFAEWVKYLVMQPVNRPAGLLHGLKQSLEFGITTIGDITGMPREIREVPVPSNSPRVVSFGEVRAMATRRSLLADRLESALHPPVDERWQIGISPHAPYSIEANGYARCLNAASARHLPITTHLAETLDEAEFLQDHSGPLREIWNAIGGWDDQVPTFAGGPIRFAQSLGLLDSAKSSFAHVNYCDDEDLSLLAAGEASVIYCPRTHRYFNHPPHRWREMLERGINVAAGTDSCASSPDLNLVEDLRLLHEIAPEVRVQALWEMATIRAARALGMSDRVGSITPGKFADFTIFEALSIEAILELKVQPKEVWINGENACH